MIQNLFQYFLFELDVLFILTARAKMCIHVLNQKNLVRTVFSEHCHTHTCYTYMYEGLNKTLNMELFFSDPMHFQKFKHATQLQSKNIFFRNYLLKSCLFIRALSMFLSSNNNTKFSLLSQCNYFLLLLILLPDTNYFQYAKLKKRQIH